MIVGTNDTDISLDEFIRPALYPSDSEIKRVAQAICSCYGLEAGATLRLPNKFTPRPCIPDQFYFVNKKTYTTNETKQS